MKELLNYIEIVRLADLQEVEKDENGRVTGVVLKPGCQKFCFLTDKEVKVTTKTKEKDGNSYYEVGISAAATLTPGEINALNNRFVIADLTDDADTYRVGNDELPCRLTLVPDLNTCQIDADCNSLVPIF